MKLISVQSRGDRLVRIYEDYLFGFNVIGYSISDVPAWENVPSNWTRTKRAAFKAAETWLEGATV